MVDRTTDVVVQLGSSGRTIFRPDGTSTLEPQRPIQLPVPAPEKKLTLFALRLAVLEKVF